MNSKYLYRAKRIDNGEWVEGYLMDENYINAPFNDDVGGRFDEPIEIDPETVCKYIECLDVFENDIIVDEEDGEIYTVEWSDEDLAFIAVEVGTGGTEWLMEFSKNEINVIGNIFDNPELLNNSENDEEAAE